MEDLISTQAARKHATLAASVSLAGLYVAPSDVRHRQVKFSSKWHARLRWREGRGFVRAWDKDRAPRSRADGTPPARTTTRDQPRPLRCPLVGDTPRSPRPDHLNRTPLRADTGACGSTSASSMTRTFFLSFSK